MNEISIKEIRDKNNYYENTINALLCFIALTTWENNQKRANCYYSFGRRMTTSASNTISPNQDVTPDCVIQTSSDLGYIIEVKISLPSDETHWNKIINQLEKYDDNLIGWWTDDERIPNHNVILLIHLTRSQRFKRYITNLIENGQYDLNDNIWGIEFVSSQETEEYIFFRTFWEAHNIFDRNLSNILNEGKDIPLERVKISYGNIKFYDTKPEPEYLLSIIWQDILTHKKSEVEFNKELNCYPIKIDIRELTKELQRSYGSTALQKSCNIDRNEEREIEYPKQSWVKEALDILCKLELAAKDQENMYTYTIFFRELRLQKRDIVEYFAKHRAKKEKKEEMQRKLFEDEMPDNETK